jgi:broad specificity phosphatase PhoE
MEAPGIARQRQPFLAPIWLAALIAVVGFGVLLAGYRSLTTTTIIVTRHAEKVLGTIADAPLTPEGELRAQQLARTLGAAPGPARINAIYTVNIRSAVMTAAPLASRLSIQPTILRESDLQGLTSRLLRTHRGRTVLVVARADTVVQMIRALTHAKTPAIGENDYGSAYVINVPSIGSANVIEIKY